MIDIGNAREIHRIVPTTQPNTITTTEGLSMSTPRRVEVKYTWGIVSAKDGSVLMYNIDKADAERIVAGESDRYTVVPVSTQKYPPASRRLEGCKIHSIHGTVVAPVKVSC